MFARIDSIYSIIRLLKIDFANLQKDLNERYKIVRCTQMLNKELNDVTRKTCAVVVRGILWCCFFTKNVTFFIHLM